MILNSSDNENNWFVGYALIQLPELLLFIYDYLKSHFNNQSNLITFVEKINSLDGTLCDYKGKEKRCQNHRSSPGTKHNESLSTTKDEITKIKSALDEILLWKNEADENIDKLLGMMDKKILSKIRVKLGLSKEATWKSYIENDHHIQFYKTQSIVHNILI